MRPSCSQGRTKCPTSSRRWSRSTTEHSVRLPGKLKRILLVVIVVAACEASAEAQFCRGFAGFFRVRPRFAHANTSGHGFNYCRVMYTSNRREAGGQGWSTDYPDAERNFSKRL